MYLDEFISTLTLEEKIALVSGHDNFYTNSVSRKEIPSICLSDGPHGLRKVRTAVADDISNSEPATAFPTAVTVASSWNEDNAYKIGEAIGRESKHYGVNVVLGPGVNIKKNPLCGRNFEYYSEDPLIAGKMGASMVNGIQKEGVGACVKHFALNSTENYRFMGNSVCDARAMREIYLKAFERIVYKANPTSIMCAYNKVNGKHCSENRELLTGILREEWGYDGLVMSDWGAVKNRVKGVKAGLDLEMPGDTLYCRKKLYDAVESGELKMEELDKCVRRVLELVEKTYYEENPQADFDSHNALSARIAEDGAVLMKNDGVLPLNVTDRVCVVGEMFENMRYQGAGSSQINAMKVTSPKDAFDALGVRYAYSKGYEIGKDIDPDLIDEAVEESAIYDKVLVFVGLTDNEESEGEDRKTLSIAENQLALIDALVETGIKVVVVLFGGSVSDLSYADDVSAILNMFLPGQNGGEAVANLLFGKVSPSGRLSETWIDSYADVAFFDEYGKGINEVYKESIYVGYRYYTTANVPVRYPFGYGLSYTTFSYSDMSLSVGDSDVFLSCTVKNTGSMRGGEVVQVYVRAPEGEVFKPIRELRAFKKVYLDPNESKTVEIKIAKSDLRYFNIDQNRWVLENGEYVFELCSDCESVIARASYYEIEGEEVSSPYTGRVSDAYKRLDLSVIDNALFEEMSGLKIPKTRSIKPFTTESRIDTFQEGLIGKLIYKILMSVPAKKMKEAESIQDEVKRQHAIKGAEFIKRNMETNCLRAMSMSDRRLPYNIAEGLVALSNWRFIKAIGKFVKKIKAPKLPDEK